MTKFIPQIFGDSFKDFDKFFVGFDDPPYNIRKVDETHYTIEMAVAGFGQNEIDIEIDGGKLVIKGNVNAEAAEDNFLFKGIANRAFTRTFALNDQVEVKDAELFNGMLKIALERLIPEEKKPKKVPVKSGKGKQFLTEEQKDALSETL